MVSIKFFGLLRSNHHIKQLTLDITNMTEIIDYLTVHYPAITRKELEEAVIFVNQKKVMHLKRFTVPLSDGDEVVLTTYVGGG